MAHRKFLIGQRVLVRNTIDPSSAGDASNNIQAMDPETICELVAPEVNVRGKEGTILAYVQPVWNQHTTEGRPSLHQYEVDIDTIGTRLVLEPWLDSNPGDYKGPSAARR